MKLARELAKQAKAKGICKPWYEELKSLEAKESMIQMYLNGIDFCLANDYPDNGFIRAHFKGFMEKYGIFLDDAIIVENKPKCVCLGATNGRVVVRGFDVCEVFAKHESKLTIIAQDNAFVVVDVFDDAVVDIQASDRAKVCVNHYGGSINEKTEGEALVKIREKNKKTY